MLRLIKASDAVVTWHDEFHNRKGLRGEFFEIKSDPHWVMISVSNVRFSRSQRSAWRDAKSPEDLLRMIDEAQAALDKQKL